MINTVRNTVLSVLNKNNYGYISPSDFNLYAKQAQLDIFEELFSTYNVQINKENARVSGTGYADIRKGIEEQINLFSETKGLYRNNENVYYTPSQSTTGGDYFFINKVLVYESVLDEGTTTDFDIVGNKIIDATADFINANVAVGDIVAIERFGVHYLKVLSVDSSTVLTVTGTHLDASGIEYAIYKKGTRLNDADAVSHNKITMLFNSSLTSPNVMFPAYTTEYDSMTILPESVVNVGRVISQYIRYPKEPNWTYTQLISGEPSYDPSQPDFQDFELSLEYEADLITRILQYAGLSIREIQVYQAEKAEEMQTKQEQ